MISVHPQYITDPDGKNLVVIPRHEFDTIMEALEDLDDVRLYDEAKKEDDNTRILFSDYLKQRRLRNA